MNIKLILGIMLLVGIFFTIFGLKLLFQKGYVEKLRTGIWKPGELSEKNFPGKSGYNYDKYTTGIGSLAFGIILLIGSLYGFFFLRDLRVLYSTLLI